MNWFMLLASAFWAIAGLIFLGLTIERHYVDIHGKSSPLPSVMRWRLQRIGGMLCLFMSLFFCASYKGWSVGSTTWFAVFACAALLLMLMFSYCSGYVKSLLKSSLGLAIITSLYSILA